MQDGKPASTFPFFDPCLQLQMRCSSRPRSRSDELWLVRTNKPPANPAGGRDRLPGAIAAAIASGRGRANRRQRRCVHSHLPQRRTEPSRYVGHEAGRAGRNPRRVQADRDDRARHSTVRALAAPGAAGASRDDRAFGASQRQQRPRGGGLHGADRPRPRRCDIAIGAHPNDNPSIGSVVGKLRPPATPVVPYVSLPYITKEGAGGPPQPGFFGGLLGRTRDPLFVLNDPNAPTFAVPELTPAGDVPVARLGQRRDLLRDVAKLDPIQQRRSTC